jgi:hypothetical protein
MSDVRTQVEVMEYETRRFYERAIEHVTDLGIRKITAHRSTTAKSWSAQSSVLGMPRDLPLMMAG